MQGASQRTLTTTAQPQQVYMGAAPHTPLEKKAFKNEG
jgi:hypothetical protein